MSRQNLGGPCYLKVELLVKHVQPHGPIYQEVCRGIPLGTTFLDSPFSRLRHPHGFQSVEPSGDSEAVDFLQNQGLRGPLPIRHLRQVPPPQGENTKVVTYDPLYPIFFKTESEKERVFNACITTRVTRRLRVGICRGILTPP